jgi:16S rRNA A1518/A1519 N6-dimethyltransferase RsmA/KsgA/DIM1 with predicted DNA glycosylase/AP lyase activity
VPIRKYSPHCYTAFLNINESDIVVDIGTTEGNFYLDIINKVSRIYMFEWDKKWNKALQETFKPYKDKVVIINQRIGKKIC